MTMAERGILFSAPMVRAIIEGRKTQTRRIVKPQPISDAYNGRDGDFVIWDRTVQRLAPSPSGDPRSKITVPVPCPYGVAGARLWVRETWAAFIHTGTDKKLYHKHGVIRHETVGHLMQPREVVYRADGDDVTKPHRSNATSKWRPSIFMPRWASRLTLEVVAVRVERLSAISGEDVVAEGFDLPAGVDESAVARDRKNVAVALRFDFLGAFRRMNKLAPDADPWVWVVIFKRIEQEPRRG